MKALLINPAWEAIISRKGKRYNRHFPPLDLLNCAALLEQEKIEVEVLDANFSELTPLEIAAHASRFDKAFVTSAPHYNWQCPNIDFEVFLDFIKPFDKQNLYLMGTHCSIYPEKILQLTDVAGIIRGEPEYTILEICQGKASRDIQGLTFKLNGKNLVHFAAFKNHIGFYPGFLAIEAFRKELSPYKSAKGSVQFPIGKPVPYDLVRRIVIFRMTASLEEEG